MHDGIFRQELIRLCNQPIGRHNLVPRPYTIDKCCVLRMGGLYEGIHIQCYSV